MFLAVSPPDFHRPICLPSAASSQQIHPSVRPGFYWLPAPQRRFTKVQRKEGRTELESSRHTHAFARHLSSNQVPQMWFEAIHTLNLRLFVLSCPFYSLMNCSEFRLIQDADPDRAMLVGFELLLARVECYRLLEQLDTNPMGPQPQVRAQTRQQLIPYTSDSGAERSTTLQLR